MSTTTETPLPTTPSALSLPAIFAVSSTKRALDCPEILITIGEWIPLFEQGPDKKPFIFKPRTLLNCCLVSKHWYKTLWPLVWRVDDRGSMRRVPWMTMTMNSRYVRTYLGYWGENCYNSPTLHSRLRRLTIGHDVQNIDEAVMMIRTNKDLQMLSLFRLSPFAAFYKRAKVNVADVDDHDDLRDDVFSPTNPLGHLQPTLEELSVDQTPFQGMEFYCLLRAVARGRLHTLKLTCLSGTFDLHDLVFESLTRLHLCLYTKKELELSEIIGRSPHLEHLELIGPESRREASFLEPLIHILRGIQPLETLKQRDDQSRVGTMEPRQWSRPRLRTLRFQKLHWIKDQSDGEELGNDITFLDLVQAHGNIHSWQHETTRMSSLRELELPIWVLDTLVREAIEVYNSTLEVLKIRNCHQKEDIPSWKVRQQGRVLRRILQSCSKLRDVELTGIDIIVTMKDILGDFETDHHPLTENDNEGRGLTRQTPEVGEQHFPTENGGVKALTCPELKSLKLTRNASYHARDQKLMEEERLYVDGSENNNGHSTGIWIIPRQKWDTTLDDGTDFLLDTRPSNCELAGNIVEEGRGEHEGGKLLKKFLRYISLSKNLKELQLSQLRLRRIG
ncbi:MAG: hypothetical protein J3Q66DRAFT_342246 [Benniella sp.]|nr:MAG: hypothetical protein J3Q66DRAFT_342246 [Benniella sp.]